MTNKTKSTGETKYRIRYSEEFKHQVCQKFLSGQFTKTEIQERYHLRGKSRLLSWLRELGYISENGNGFMNIPKVAKIKPSENPSEYIRHLERALEEAQLQAAIYHKMIEIAETGYKITIRKNSNTK